MIENPTERHLQTPPQPRIEADRVTLFQQRRRRQKTIFIQNYQNQHILNLPIYIYGYLTQIVKVDLEKQQVMCKFNIYATVITNVTEAHVKKLRRKEMMEMEEEEYQLFIEREHRMLKNYIVDNLILEFNTYVVDIASQERRIYDLPDDLASQDSDSQSEEQLQNHYYRQFPTTYTDNSVTYFINGTFPCNVSLNNFYFPFHTLNTNITFRARQQFYDNIIIKYQLNLFDQDIKDINKQFGIKIQNECHRRFGLYGIDMTQSSQNLRPLKSSIEMFKYVDDNRNTMQDSQYLSQTKGMQFTFKIYSFKTPFILRNVVPLLLLSFVSLMCYFPQPAVEDTYANVIFLSVTIIQLLSNFRSSQFDNSTFNIFQINLLAIVLINFLLVIVCTDNYYSPRASNPNANVQTPIFWISVAIAAVFVVVNIIILVYFGHKAAHQYSRIPSKKQLTHLWMWDQDIVKSMVEEFQSASIFSYQRREEIYLEDEPN